MHSAMLPAELLTICPRYSGALLGRDCREDFEFERAMERKVALAQFRRKRGALLPWEADMSFQDHPVAFEIFNMGWTKKFLVSDARKSSPRSDGVTCKYAECVDLTFKKLHVANSDHSRRPDTFLLLPWKLDCESFLCITWTEAVREIERSSSKQQDHPDRDIAGAFPKVAKSGTCKGYAKVRIAPGLWRPCSPSCCLAAPSCRCSRSNRPSALASPVGALSPPACLTHPFTNLLRSPQLDLDLPSSRWKRQFLDNQ